MIKSKKHSPIQTETEQSIISQIPREHMKDFIEGMVAMAKAKRKASDLQSRQLSDELMQDEMPGATPPKLSRIKDLLVDPPAIVADIVHRYHDQKATELDELKAISDEGNSNPGATNNTRGR